MSAGVAVLLGRGGDGQFLGDDFEYCDQGFGHASGQ